MHLKRLRLFGFKSFVEPTELLIEPGLTGVVGPNGCGKSNLLEALRWVMGESSYKSMRASAMDDVIFSGTQGRPGRNAAEVTLFLDNSARKAPAEFNDADILEVTRRIERETGSSYRVNGRDVRARDVKLLFEDAATGARSPALVRQGQIGEIVNAKPEARRRILEDAAGIAGLHSRRHEAELRLKAAESNLARVADVLGQMNSQVQSLKRQARQARRYKELSGEIRKSEAIQAYLNWAQAQAMVDASEAEFREALAVLGLASEAESVGLRLQIAAAEALPQLRNEEAKRAAILQRLTIEQETIDAEAERASQRQAELESAVAAMRADTVREEELVEEAGISLRMLDDEQQRLSQADTGIEDECAGLNTAAAGIRLELKAAEAELDAATTAMAEQAAERRRLEMAAQQATSQTTQLHGQIQRARQDLETLSRGSEMAQVDARKRDVDKMAGELGSIEDELMAAESALAEANLAEQRAQSTAIDARTEATEIRAQIGTLKSLLGSSGEGQWPAILDQLRVEAGFETALGAALGDDLEISSDPAAPMHWSRIPATGDAPLPAGASALTQFVGGAPELTRRLAQTGLVEAKDGPRLQALLKAGQCLVSETGAVWRWDGLVAAADAPSAAARRLSERNRLEQLEEQAIDIFEAAEIAGTALTRAADSRKAATERERALRERIRDAQRRMSLARELFATAERQARETGEKRARLDESLNQYQATIAAASAMADEARQALEALSDLGTLTAQHAANRDKVAEIRSRLAAIEAELAGIAREQHAREQRMTAIAADRERTELRIAKARNQIAALASRIDTARRELVDASDRPGQLAEKRQRLLNELQRAETGRSEAADALAEAETHLRERDAALREIQAELVNARELRARCEARLEAARERRSEHARSIRETFECAPQDCLALAELEPDSVLPDLTEIERTVQRLKLDRERLGGVNLRADDELTAIEEQFSSLDRERGDLEDAIARLRQGIAKLNKEGRKRLLDAFEEVNGHFHRLFMTLFSGGEARLELVESDDPLEAGLEIIARPPGKKPNVLSLLSGGEQTLTALSLIFAVFLTNPSPICVLDEVDAPLDDSNVDRFSTMMEEMARSTETRFLVITHHPMTMVRMDRLFGVTMAEQGVSQLVSVDLTTAERFLEAG